jgi:hypothetical protein
MRKALGVALTLGLLVPMVLVLQPQGRATAAEAGLWNPGYIISDAVFYDGDAISSGAVQSFLESRVTSCVAGYTCLRDYRQQTPSMAASSLCSAYSGGNQSAAEIIANVGAACNINPRVLLVLLEKEQSLVTSRSPSQTRYNAATGFSCPDTAPCDPAYAGFFYQVYYAARQFQNYAATPTRWNYQAGRVNNILYHPNTACGSAPIYIQNKATAALYIYTPYQPNAASLANLYGTGDGCSTYGNRNFWRIFTDWFGSPIETSSLLRTIEDSSVYLVSGSKKYPISSQAVFAALSPLGQVGYVSQAYLNSFTTGQTVGRSIRDPAGTIYFYDAGIKLPFTTCAQAEDYGASCAETGYVQLTDAQAAAFITGPTLSSVMGTVEGARYLVSDGTKSEILDDQAQLQAGIPIGMNVLTENAVADLELVAPITRDGVYIGARGAGGTSLLSGGQRYAVLPGDEPALGVSSRMAGALWLSSIAEIPSSPTVFSGVAVPYGGTSPTVLTQEGRYTLTAGGLSPSLTPVPVSQEFLDSYPDRGSITEGSFIKSPTRADVYVVMPGDVRPVGGWGALLALTPDGSPKILTVSEALIGKLTMGPVALTAGTLVRSPNDATVYYVNGVTSRIALSSFEYTTEAGMGPLVYSTDAIIRAYPLSEMNMTFGFACEADRYVAAGGLVHLVSPELLTSYPFDYVPLDRFSCMQLKKGTPATSFIRTPDGSIYQLMDGQKRPISSMTRFAELGGGSFITVVPRFANTYPTGPAA